MEGFSGLPAWVQILATAISTVVAMTVAMVGYFKRAIPKADVASPNIMSVSATLSDDGLIRDLNHGIKHLSDRLYETERKIERAGEALEVMTELMVDIQSRRARVTRRRTDT